MALLPDREAVDRIRDLLDHTEDWSADLLGEIRDVVLATGRDCAGELGMPLPAERRPPFALLSIGDQIEHLREEHALGADAAMLETERLRRHEHAHIDGRLVASHPGMRQPWRPRYSELRSAIAVAGLTPARVATRADVTEALVDRLLGVDPPVVSAVVAYAIAGVLDVRVDVIFEQVLS